MLMIVNRKIYYISMGCTKSQFVCLPGLLYFYIEIFPTYLKTNESNERFAIPFMRNHFYLQFRHTEQDNLCKVRPQEHQAEQCCPRLKQT